MIKQLAKATLEAKIGNKLQAFELNMQN